LSDDVEALRWLSSPNIASVKLMRRLRHVLTPHEEIYDAGQGLGFSSTDLVSSAGVFVPGTVALGKNMHFKTTLHEVATAVWCLPPKDIPQESNIRHLEGEIHLSVDLEPSCACEFFNVEVGRVNNPEGTRIYGFLLSSTMLRCQPFDLFILNRNWMALGKNVPWNKPHQCRLE